MKSAAGSKPKVNTPLLTEVNLAKDSSLATLQQRLDAIIASKQVNDRFNRPCFDSRRHCTTSGFKVGILSLAFITNNSVASLTVGVTYVIFARLKEVLSAQYLQNMKLVDLSNGMTDSLYKDVIFLGVDVSLDAQSTFSSIFPFLLSFMTLLTCCTFCCTAMHSRIAYFSDGMKNEKLTGLIEMIAPIITFISFYCMVFGGLVYQNCLRLF
jgi:hypothetical protein